MRLLKYWNKYVFLGGLFIFATLCGVTLALVRFLPGLPPVSGVQGQITIIPVSTFTPTIASIPEVTPTASPISYDGMQIGIYVQITGTGNSGLRIRSEPGLNSQVVFYGLENEVFLVEDGPVFSDDYLWWLITTPYDSTRKGWAASDYLKVVLE